MSALRPTHILVGASFNPTHGPYLMIDHSEEDGPITRRKCPIWDRALTIQPLTVRHCIGQYDILTQRYSPCPTQNIVPSWTSQSQLNCQPCFDAIGFHPSFFKLPKESLSLQQQQYNLRPHYVYLADFGEGAMKVGTAYEGRFLLRWLDQGARMATILRKCKDAYEAREWEVTISKSFQLPEGITMAQKKTLLIGPYNFQEREEAITKLALDITKKFEFDQTVVKVHNFQKSYFQGDIPSSLTDVVIKGKPLKIKVVGLIGNLLVFSYENGHGMTSLSHLTGKASIEFEENPPKTLDEDDEKEIS